MTRSLTQWTAASTLLFAAACACVHAQQPGAAATPPPPPAAAPTTPAPAAAAAAQPMPQPVVQQAMPARPMVPVRPMMPPPPPPPAAPAAPAKHLVGPPGIAAMVNNVPIKTTEVQTLAMQAAGQQVLDQLITTLLIDQEAKKDNAVPTPADINAKIADLRRQISAQGQGMTLEQLLAQRGITMGRVKTMIRTQLEVQNLVAQNVVPIPMVHVRHILIRTKNPNNDPTVKVHTEDEAKAIIGKIQADLKAGKSFEEEAKMYTEDPSGKTNGGDLPAINKTTPFDQNFLTAALALKPGEVTQQPVESVFGLHLIYCVSTSEAPSPADAKLFADAEKQYRDQQVAMSAQGYVQSLKAKAKILNYTYP